MRAGRAGRPQLGHGPGTRAVLPARSPPGGPSLPPARRALPGSACCWKPPPGRAEGGAARAPCSASTLRTNSGLVFPHKPAWEHGNTPAPLCTTGLNFPFSTITQHLRKLLTRTLNADPVQTMQLLNELRFFRASASWPTRLRQRGGGRGRQPLPPGTGCPARNTPRRSAVKEQPPALAFPARRLPAPRIPVPAGGSRRGPLARTRPEGQQAAPRPSERRRLRSSARHGGAGRGARARPLEPAGPRSPLSPPASASSSAWALGAAGNFPSSLSGGGAQRGGLCGPAERGPRGAGGARTGGASSSSSRPATAARAARQPPASVPYPPPAGAGAAAAVPCPARPATMWSTRCGA